MSRFTSLIRKNLYIDGKWVSSARGLKFPSINPATGEVIAEIDNATSEDVDKVLIVR